VFTTSYLKVDLNPEFLFLDSHSEIVIQVYPVNLLGFSTPFKKISVGFDVVEGKNLVELMSNPDFQSAVVRSKGKEGEAVIAIYLLDSGAPISKVLIKIIPKGIALSTRHSPFEVG
ncbi:MAG: hypothetical protein ACRDFC_06695, partial [Ignavibacteria bacterium]